MRRMDNMGVAIAIDSKGVGSLWVRRAGLLIFISALAADYMNWIRRYNSNLVCLLIYTLTLLGPVVKREFR